MALNVNIGIGAIVALNVNIGIGTIVALNVNIGIGPILKMIPICLYVSCKL